MTIRQRPQIPLGPKDPINPTRARQGLSRAELRMAIEAQGGLCLICSRPIDERTGVVDHDHKKALAHGHNPAVGCRACFRGVLDARCNTALGWVRDDPAMLRRAAAYLERAR